MFDRRIAIFAFGLIIAITGSSCETLHKAGVPGLEMYVKPDKEVLEKAEKQRDLFVNERDHKAFYWLLSKYVRTGMPMSDVEHTLGEPGELDTDSAKYSKEDGLYQVTDTAFRWGPDNQGNAAVIFFRDGHVVNFDPKGFANP